MIRNYDLSRAVNYTILKTRSNKRFDRNARNKSLFVRRMCSSPGYGRRGNRSPRLRFKTVLETFTSHGSSPIRLLSRVPSRACGLDSHTFAPFSAHPYLTFPSAHSVFGANRPFHLRMTVPTSAYPKAFPLAFASWGIPPSCGIRLTPTHH